jgi:hypothetical protein
MAMITKGLLVRLKANPGMERSVEDFLCSALLPVQDEPHTVVRFAGRHGHDVVDVFPDTGVSGLPR